LGGGWGGGESFFSQRTRFSPLPFLFLFRGDVGSEVAPNRFPVCQATAALNQRDRLSICVLAMQPFRPDYSDMTGGKLVRPSVLPSCQPGSLILNVTGKAGPPHYVGKHI